MKKVFIILFAIGIIVSCRLLDKVEEQKADVTITLDYSKSNNNSNLSKGKSGAVNVKSIDEAKLVIYNINYSYSDVSSNYTDMNIQSTRPITDFENYWVTGVESELDEISSNNCTIESRHNLNISNNQASGEFEIDAGVKYFLVGLFENNKLKYGGYSNVLNFKIGDSKTVSISLSDANTIPAASFTISPTSGTILTTFNFDASGSSDNEDATSALQVRWDWENDGSYDTNYSTTKTATHQYTSTGTYTVKLEVKDSEGLIHSTTKTVSVSNTAPTASFTIDPTLGTVSTVFNFDASGSTDNEDVTSTLQVRWDWENDGTFDTDYSTTKTATHQYSAVGAYIVRLEVKDSGGMINSTSSTLTIDFNYGSITDIDGNTYKTIQIGDQLWMAENLKVTHYRNGDSIPNVTSGGDWSNLSNGAYCNYNNDESDVSTYGRLYNWYAVDDSRNLAPEGWHIPSDEEWRILEMYLGMSQGAAHYAVVGDRGTDQGNKLKSSSGWENNGNGTNESGFSALPGGFRLVANANSEFIAIKVTAYFWSSSEYSNSLAWYRALASHKKTVYRYAVNKNQGFSIRCIKD